ncbi:MAG: adenylate/guanylate cyclase domain-containing protein, partial [Desulfobacterales bacterium]
VVELLESPRGLEMSGELRDVTFLVSDLRGFSDLSLKLSPQDVIRMVNCHLKHMVDTIEQYRGTINDFEGDAILVFFGAPLMADDDQPRAVACAIEMQNRMMDVNTELEQLGLPELSMGIGINSGTVVVGNIGSEKRAQYSALGSAINTAYRIESFTTGGQILIGPKVHEELRSSVHVRDTFQVEFKGVDKPLVLYDIEGIDGEYSHSLSCNHPDILKKV